MSHFKRLKKALLHLDRERLHLAFLTSCRDMGVIPKFLQTRSKFIKRYHANRKYYFELGCLKSIIRSKHALVNSLSKRIYGDRNDGLYHKFACYAVGGVFDFSMTVINNFRHEQEQMISERHAKKLENLTMGMSSLTSSAGSNFINLSNHDFSDKQLALLEKGPKYIHHSAIAPINFIPQLEDVVKQVNAMDRDLVRSQIFLAYSKYLRSNNMVAYNEQHTINSIKKIPDIVFIPTDKSNKLAALNKSDFERKMDETINTLDCTIVNTDPLKNIMNKTVRIAKEFKTTEWTEEVNRLAKVNNLGVIPKMVAVLKDHKQALPLRPIVVRCESPTFLIEKTLVFVLKDLLPYSAHALKSSYDFIQKLDSVQLPTQFLMFSLDVISLYPSVDMTIAADYISDQLNSNSSISNHMKSTILSAFNLIKSSNYFTYNQRIYFQNTGAPMGSPISALAAECILRPLEENFLASTSIKPICWFRFIDDVFGIWPTTIADFTDFFNLLNQYDPKIKFTMELEQNQQLAYLDVSLKRENNTISRTVHRKSINSNTTIPHDANTTGTYKKAAYKAQVRRAFKICSPDKIDEELATIRRIAIQNGYTFTFINNIISKIADTHQHPPPSKNKSDMVTKRISLQYANGFHEKISRILRPHNIHIVAQAGIKLKDFLRTNFDPIPFKSLPGVYQIPIAHQNGTTSYYIGQTARKLEIRLAEHRNDIRKDKQNSAIARVVYNDPTLQVKFEDAKILAPYTNASRTLIRESLEIYRRRSEICNDQDSYTVPSIWLSLIQ